MINKVKKAHYISKIKTKSRIETAFSNILDLTIIVKFFNGIIEILISLFLLFSIKSNYLLNKLFAKELIEDRNDIVANWLLSIWHGMFLRTKYLIVIYLLVHGIVNLFIFFSIWKHKTRLYPAAIILLLLLVIYQLYRFSHTFSLFLYTITLLDILIILLVLLQYEKRKV